MKQRLFSIITALALSLSLLPVTAAASESAGETWTDGLTEAPEGYTEEGDTITITTPEALAWLAVLVNSEEVTGFENNPTYRKTVVLEDDLDLGGKNWVPIGNGNFAKDYINAFAGSFDGNGHTISNLTIESDGRDNIGLFGNVHLNGSPATYALQDITVENAAITTNQFINGGHIGVLAGQVHGAGAISGCTVSGTINCREACTNTYAGGMFGFLNPTTGFVDQVYLTVDSCFANVNITGAPLYAGGFVGYLGSCGAITNCGAVGNVAITDPYSYMPFAGGFIGSLETMNGSVRFESCYATGNVSLSTSSADDMTCAGGFLGGIDIPKETVSIEGCMSSGDVEVIVSEDNGMTLVGGFIGNGAQDPILTVSNSYSTGDVTAANGTHVMCGGFMGYSASTVENCYSLGSVTSSNGGKYAWAFGFNGYTVSGASFLNCYALGASMDGGTHVATFLNGNHTMNNCYYYSDMALLNGTNVSSQTAVAMSAEEIMSETAFFGFDDEIWQLSADDIPLLSGIPDEVEKTEKPVYLTKTVTFDSQGGTSVSSQAVSRNQAADRPDDPTRANYTFGGWYTDPECTEAYDFNLPVTEDLILYAKWTALLYTVTFDSQGGSTVNAVKVEHGLMASVPTPPTKDGSTFGGWYTDPECTEAYDFNSPVTEDLILYAKWTALLYTVSFDSQGGSAVNAVKVELGLMASIPTPPTKDGSTFDGWYTDAECTVAYNFSTPVTEDLILYAKWTATSAVDPAVPVIDVTLNKSELHLITGESEQLTAVVVPGDASNKAMAWTSSNTAVAAVDANGTVTAVGAGSAVITVTTEDGNKTAACTVSVKDAVILPDPPAGDEGEQFRLVMETGISEVPAGLQGIEALDTPAELEAVMRLKITQADAGISAGNTAVYDVTLMVSTDSGKSWTPAAPANFPAGGLTVTLPYPEGTDSSYRFTVIHMFTSPTFNKTPGDIERPAAANTKAGIQFTVTGLSPISVGWKAPQAIGPSSGGGGSSAGSYRVNVESASHGKTVSNRTYASAGTTVTLTVTPDSGYALDTLTITDSRGGEIKLTARDDGTYTFTMPHSTVTVKTSFSPLPDDIQKPCDGGADCPSRGFTDLMGAGTWYHEAVDYVLRSGLMNGYSNGTFGPDNRISRAQLVQILYNKEDRPAVTDGSAFTDVAPGAWCAPAITWAANRGIAGGYGSGQFGPNDYITREQLAVMLWRYAGSPTAASRELDFNDADKAGGYALDALCWAVENGIINGKSGGILDPKGPATRAQAAQMLMNFLEK